jgi:hypothetical protein
MVSVAKIVIYFCKSNDFPKIIAHPPDFFGSGPRNGENAFPIFSKDARRHLFPTPTAVP